MCITSSRLITSGLAPETPAPLCFNCKQTNKQSVGLVSSCPSIFSRMHFKCSSSNEYIASLRFSFTKSFLYYEPFGVAGPSETFPDPDSSPRRSRPAGAPPRPSSRRDSFSFFCSTADSTRASCESGRLTPASCLSWRVPGCWASSSAVCYIRRTKNESL